MYTYCDVYISVVNLNGELYENDKYFLHNFLSKSTKRNIVPIDLLLLIKMKINLRHYATGSLFLGEK